MTVNQDEQILAQLFQELTGTPPALITPLRPHASERRIYRLSGSKTGVVGVINPNAAENDAFVYFAKHFASLGLPVPEIYLYSPTSCAYLEQDLGDETLFDFITRKRAETNEEFPREVEQLYRASLELLPEFQIGAAKTIDFSRCYPETELLPGTFAGDCASFATDLVGRMLPDFDTASLTGDFAALIAALEEAPASFFVYRDFQSRNIMRLNDRPVFIDFQSGRRGALQYDVVSLLYQSSTRIPHDARRRLIDHYCSIASHMIRLERGEFERFLSGFVICRMLQVLGVYGRQGLAGGKAYFTNSIPTAVATLASELNSPGLLIKLPKLRTCAEKLVATTTATQTL